jgi:hypothetical protein
LRDHATPAFYAALGDGHSLLNAVESARQELRSHGLLHTAGQLCFYPRAGVDPSQISLANLAPTRLSDLHLAYLRSWFGKPWATVNLADISGRDENAHLHRSFQEHLAVCELTCTQHEGRRPPVPDDRRFPHGIVQWVQSRPDLWENVVRLAADDLTAQGRSHDLGAILVALARPYLQSGTSAPPALLALEIGTSQGLLAEPCDEFDPRSHHVGLLQRTALKALTDATQIEPEQREKVGQMLERHPGLDTRRGMGLRIGGLPDIDWVKIPLRLRQRERNPRKPRAAQPATDQRRRPLPAEGVALWHPGSEQ